MVSKDDDMYSQLMVVSQNAFKGAYYETSYHALCAAMHLANSTRNGQRLIIVAQVAKSQIDWIDAHAPQHRMSNQSALKRNGSSFYKMLLKQIDADLLIMQQQRRREELWSYVKIT